MRNQRFINFFIVAALLVFFNNCGRGLKVGSDLASSLSANPSPIPAISPSPSNNPMGQNSAARLLVQGTFGPSMNDISSTSASNYSNWFASQQAATPSMIHPTLLSKFNNDPNAAWWTNVVFGGDQLRQRMAFALYEVMPVRFSADADRVDAKTIYYDILTSNAFGNFRDLLYQVSTNPAMGHYLSSFKSEGVAIPAGAHPDENYAREIMQLFTIGLVKLNIDGTEQVDSTGTPIPAYVQVDVENLARVFTGWGSNPQTHTGESAWQYDDDPLNPMICYNSHHDTNSKIIVSGISVAAGGSCSSEMDQIVDALFNHPNVAPFICKQLIQHFVTSNPSPAYVQRVATIFNNNGNGVRGDLFAVIKTILQDAEATTTASSPGSGKLREPIMLISHLFRAFGAYAAAGTFTDQQIGQNGFYNMGEQVFETPTVFSFFRPDYQRPGPLANAGLVAPEFQILNELTVALTSDALARYSYSFKDSAGSIYGGYQNYSERASNIILQTAPYEQYAANPSTLVDQLNVVLMAGQMSASMKTTIVNYLNGIKSLSFSQSNKGPPTPGMMVSEAISLIVNSPQFAVQR